MLKKKLLIIGAVILLLIGIVIFAIIVPGESILYPVNVPLIVLNHPPRLSSIIPYIQDGDILLRMAVGPWSRMFREYSKTDKRFSHSGIVRMRDEKVTIIQAMGSTNDPNLGVEEVPINHFLAVAYAVGVFRVKGVDGSLISDEAVKYIDHKFDYEFNLEDDSKVYCTELIYLAITPFKSRDFFPTIYVDEVKTNVIPIDAISNNPGIEELVYIIDQTEQDIDEDNKATLLKRDNPVKHGFLEKVMYTFRRYRIVRQD